MADHRVADIVSLHAVDGAAAELDDEEVFCDACTPASTSSVDGDEDRFLQIVGVLEDVIMTPNFKERVETFCKSHCDVFENSDENKLEYMPLFEEYTSMVEDAICAAVTAVIPDFDMAEFEDMLTRHAEDLTGDVFDVLVSLGDFEEFKSLMISYKEQLHWERSGMPVATHASSAGASSAAPAAPALRMSPIVLPSHAGLAPTIIPLGK